MISITPVINRAASGEGTAAANQNSAQALTANDITIYLVSPVTFHAYKEHFEHADEIERLLIEQHKHRYDMFVDLKNWRSSNIGQAITTDPKTGIASGYEWDSFDRDNSVYSIAVGPDFQYHGSTRATSTILPTMLDDPQFKDVSFYPGTEPIKDYDVFEGTRIISPNSKLYEKAGRVVAPVKGGIGHPLMYSHLRLGLHFGMTRSMGTMPSDLQKKMYGKMDLPYRALGDEVLITDSEGHLLDEGDPTQAYAYDITQEIVKNVAQTIASRMEHITGAPYRPKISYGVPASIQPALIQHMKDNFHIDHPHRLETDLIHLASPAEPPHAQHTWERY